MPLSQIDQLAAEAMKSVEDDEVTEDDMENPDLLVNNKGINMCLAVFKHSV